ncbi:hypothetical protein [Microcoleus anatoxicus]|uniref:Uncharacterized protein n=1 Tax=Microcoleus anatoxicus PTRS2 TaxID=2705321 RepID=A0ABU8YX96_9CYAN
MTNCVDDLSDNFGKPPPMAEKHFILFVQNVRSGKTPIALERTH